MAEERWHELCRLVEIDDGLPVWEEAGAWTTEKLRFWHRYLETTTTAMVGNPCWPGGVVYVDLFVGAGVCRLKDSGKRIPGSVLIAAHTAKPFARIIACEAAPELAQACRARLNNTLVGNRCDVLTGDCNQCIQDIVKLIPKRSLTLSFVDPKGLDAKFSTIAKLGERRRADLVVLFADAYDIARNVEQHYRHDRDSKLDQVLGPDSRWRERLDQLPSSSGANKRKLFRLIYEEQLRKHLGYLYIRHKAIKSPNGPIYTLVYASKHKLGLKFWDEAIKKEASGQRTFTFPE
ncbi:MAG TPA: three-Cys-motif partner protein TcmP [Thermoguttaceae bacterium]|nr:three-Cys-motif partner protein TcmP [Thermoguttaceae bacterium]